MHALQLGVLGPLQISVAGRVVELRRAKQRSSLRSSCSMSERSCPRPPHRGAVGGTAAEDGRRLPPEPGLRAGKALGPDVLRTPLPVTCSTSIRSSSTCTVSSASLLMPGRTKTPSSVRHGCVRRWRCGVGRARGSCARALRASRDRASRGAENRRARRADLRRARDRAPRTAGRRARGARRRASAAGAAARSADARPVPLRKASRGAGGLQSGARDARRAARHRAVTGATAARAGDLAPRSGARALVCPESRHTAYRARVPGSSQDRSPAWARRGRRAARRRRPSGT